MEIVELSTRLEGTDTEHYNKAADYWQSVTPTINGMLGEITILKSYAFTIWQTVNDDLESC